MKSFDKNFSLKITSNCTNSDVMEELSKPAALLTSTMINQTIIWTDFFALFNNSDWLFLLFKYFLIPYILWNLMNYFWELYCIGLRDHKSSLPLPPGKMGYPFVGEMFHFFIKGANYQRKRIKEFGKLYRTHMFGRPTIFVAGSENVRKILLGEGVLVRTYWPSTTRRILGTSGIVNGDVHTHSLIKRLALKAFSPKYMHNYTPIIKLGIINHLKDWKRNKEVSILDSCKQMVSKIMMSILLGINQEDPDIQVYIQAADDIINSILTLPLDLPGCKFHKGLLAKKLIFEKLESKLRYKIEQNLEKDLLTSDEAVDSVLVTILKLARIEGTADQISLINLQNVSLEFIFAGTQSLQCASSSMIVHMSQHPEIVDQIREEIKLNGMWDTPLEEIEQDQLNKLTLSNAVVDETLRVTPTIPGGIRIALQTFEIGGFQVPKGWQVMYSIRMTHEDVAGQVLQNGPNCAFDPFQYFYCPCKRNPRPKVKCLDRNCSQNSSHFGYVPFGKGLRMCAGKNYGLLFLRILLFELVRSSQVDLSTSLHIIDKPMTKPHRSVKMKIKSHH